VRLFCFADAVRNASVARCAFRTPEANARTRLNLVRHCWYCRGLSRLPPLASEQPAVRISASPLAVRVLVAEIATEDVPYPLMRSGHQSCPASAVNAHVRACDVENACSSDCHSPADLKAIVSSWRTCVWLLANTPRQSPAVISPYRRILGRPHQRVQCRVYLHVDLSRL
jgi:hypothetical protein